MMNVDRAPDVRDVWDYLHRIERNQKVIAEGIATLLHFGYGPRYGRSKEAIRKLEALAEQGE